MTSSDCTSDLSHIEDNDVAEHPMKMFHNWIEMAKKYHVFTNIMNIATINSEKGVLNRNVILVKYDDNGFLFVTEKNSRKYADMKLNPLIAATFLWHYHDKDNIKYYRQVRINGKIKEIDNENEINKFYSNETLTAKIRSKICVCGQSYENWQQLKDKHDKILNDYRNGIETLQKNENYTVIRIIPSDMDFYSTKENYIADRILYTKIDSSGVVDDCDNDDKWKWTHIYA